jgi:hypothetical protein
MYIKEQMEGQFDEDGNPIAPAPVDNIYSFLFLEEDETGDYSYPDGSSTKSIQTYTVVESELKDWLESNIVSDEKNNQFTDNAIKVKKKNLMDYISGNKSNLSPEDREFVYKFKNNVISEIVGKPARKIDVIFPKGGGIPSTNSFSTTFIILPPKK